MSEVRECATVFEGPRRGGLKASGLRAGYLREFFLAALLLFAVAACSPVAASAENFLWRLESPQGRPAYIMGSIHLAHAGLYPLNGVLTKSFEEATVLVVEINTADMAPGVLENFVLKHGYAPGRAPLPERLSSQTRQALKASGFYKPQMDVMTPWLAALVVQVEALHRHGFKAEFGLDKYFMAEARKRKIRILELETIEEQMGMLVNMNEREADLFLLSTLLEIKNAPRTMRTFLESWSGGDTEGFARAFFEDYNKYPELRPVLDLIIFGRNRAMTAKIDRLVAREEGLCFIVVGAGHLVGEQSVLSGLRDLGWKASQM